MSQPSTRSAPLTSGQMNLYSACLPALPAGTYNITLNQQLAQLTNEASQPTFNLEQRFIVTSQRFKLNAAHITATYPPANHSGNFVNTFPHIVLDSPTYPWENSQPEEDSTPAPWLALLTVYNNESSQVEKKNVTVEKLITPDDAKTTGPTLTDTLSAADKQQQCLVLDMKLNLFRQIAPRSDELSYLCHVRQVDPASQPDSTRTHPGWSSTVVSNRLVDVSGDDATKNTVYLVSLEGLTQLLSDSPPPEGADENSQVRMALLASWSFTAVESGGDFLALLKNIDHAPLALTDITDNNALSDTNRQLLLRGYTCLPHTLRNGEKTSSWYAGPLVTTPATREKRCYASVDSALRYDQHSGMFDVSYAVAWQTGHLLALSDYTFVKSLLKWLKKVHIDQETTGLPGADSIKTKVNTLTELTSQYLQKACQTIKTSRSTNQTYPADDLPGVLSTATLGEHVKKGQPPALAIKPASKSLPTPPRS